MSEIQVDIEEVVPEVVEIHIDENSAQTAIDAALAAQLAYNNLLALILGLDNSQFNRILSINSPIVLGNLITYNPPASWLLNGVLQTMTVANEFTIPYTSSGKVRADIIYATTGGDLGRVQGVEQIGIAVLPPMPPDTLFVSIFNATDTLISGYTPSIASTSFRGTHDSEASLISAITDPVFNNFAFILDGTTLLELALYNGTAWIFQDLKSLGGGGSIPDATESTKGQAQLATEAEALAGTNDTKIITPLKLKAFYDENDLGYTPENTTNKVTTFTGNEASTTKFPVVKAILDYFTTSRIKTLLGQASSTVDGWLSSTDWNTFNNKQNAVSGKGLSTNDFTDVDKLKLDNLSNYTGFRTAQPTLAAVASAAGTGVAGDWAIITNPSGPAYFAIWDPDTSSWVEAGQSPTIPGTNLAYTVSGNTLTITSDTGNDVAIPLATASAAGLQSKEDKSKLDGIASGATNFTVANVLATVLSGLSLATGGAIVSTDTVLIAFGKIQKQINDLNTSLSSYVQTSRTINSKALSSDIVLTAADIGYNQVILTSNTTAQASWNGKVVKVRGNITITIPATGLPTGYTFEFIVDPTFTLSWAIVTKTWVFGTPSTNGPGTMGTILQDEQDDTKIYLMT